MRCIIFGGRDFDDHRFLEREVRRSGFDITEVVCGCANGADTLGFEWAKENGIYVKHFQAPWKHLGKGAGHVRNGDMAGYADCGIALPGNEGTANMIEQAEKLGLPIHHT